LCSKISSSSPAFNFGDVATLDTLYEQKFFLGVFSIASSTRWIKTAKRLPIWLDRHAETGFDITNAQAARVLETEANPSTPEGPQIPEPPRPSRKWALTGAFFTTKT